MSSDEEYIPSDDEGADDNDSDYIEIIEEEPSDCDIEIFGDDDEEWDEDKPSTSKNNTGKSSLKPSKARLTDSSSETTTCIQKKGKDDGDERHYKKRMKEFKQQLLEERADLGEDSWSSFQEVDHDSGFKVPSVIWNKLFPYQQACVKWLWELHKSCTGGIIGDEMGLGKTIQVIAFLSGLASSRIENFRESFKSLGPSIIVCPATVMHQWVQEINTWYPPLKVVILHSSGSWSKSKGKSSLIRNVNANNGILVTTYSCVNDYQEDLSAFDWHYVILDEGHKIRNPDAQTTLACKRFRTPHRIILSGSPIQNNLKELWSLFDFVVPGLLGTLPVFVEQFSIPITQGGYSNATDVQVKIAFKCATVLRDTIKPYLLRRMKDDVREMINLPDKNEQVLFCRLTDEQRDLYQRYIDSSDVKDILRGTNQMFVGLINLRKICNHPSLFSGFRGESSLVKLPFHQKNKVKPIEPEPPDDPSSIEFFERSGKMQVLEALLRIWKKQGHKILLFTQGRKMLNILDKFLTLKEYTFLTLDGSTNISQRQPLINQFNHDKEIFCFLLTTRVGGIGVNLTAASRVLIYDPDWNPSTDMQARERAWRIGQENDVTIYRLLTAGTIEEKIYHRQIFKQYLTNRILKDPKQRRFFKTNDLYELFSLAKDSESTESAAIFAGTGSDVKVDAEKEAKKRKKSHKKNKKKKKKSRKEEEQDNDGDVDDDDDSGSKKITDVENISLPPERVKELRERAKMLSQLLVKKFQSKTGEGKGVEPTSNEGNSMDCDKSSNTNQATTSSPHLSVDSSTSSSNPSSSRSKKKGIMFEGERISFLVKSDNSSRHRDRILKEAEEEAKRLETESGEDSSDSSKKRKLRSKRRKQKQKLSKKQDEYVLSKLFKRNDVHSALQHDVIEGTHSKSTPDFTLVEAEAEKIANDAIKALQRSRTQCFSAVSGIPTWTGLKGKMKRPTGKHANSSEGASTSTASSSSLLSVMRSRHRLEGSSSSNTASSAAESSHEILLHDLRSFIAFQASSPGQATTEEVLDRFRDRLPSYQTPVFKAFLNKMCDFERRNGTGVWILKPDF